MDQKRVMKQSHLILRQYLLGRNGEDDETPVMIANQRQVSQPLSGRPTQSQQPNS